MCTVKVITGMYACSTFTQNSNIMHIYEELRKTNITFGNIIEINTRMTHLNNIYEKVDFN